MRIEDLNLTDPLPEEGPWRVLIVLGEPVAKAEASGALYRITDGKLTPVAQSDLIPVEQGSSSDGNCWPGRAS